MESNSRIRYVIGFLAIDFGGDSFVLPNTLVFCGRLVAGRRLTQRG